MDPQTDNEPKTVNAVISFPKSGRTWLRVMLDALGVDAVYDHRGAGHRGRRDISELSTKGLRRFDRIVFLHRDPRDTAVSGYHQTNSRHGGYDGTISDFIRDPRHGIEKVIKYNLMWFDLAVHRDHTKIASYEALRENPVDGLASIASFLGSDIDRASVTTVVEAHTFDKMKRKEATGQFNEKWGNILTPGDPTDPNSFKVRRGKVGGYRDELSAEDIAFCDQVIAETNYCIGGPDMNSFA